MPPAVPPPLPSARPKTWFDRHWIWLAVLGGVALVAASGLSSSLGLGWINKRVKSSEGYRLAMVTVRADARVRDALGEPLEDEALTTGSFMNATHENMVFAQASLRGPKGRGTLMVNAIQTDGPWQFNTLAVTVESTHQRIDLRAAANAVR